MQPRVLDSVKDFNNLMALRVFTEACEQWCVENKNFRYNVEIKVVYFDYGQNWKYTALITTDEDDNSDATRSWQSLCPRDWSIVVECTDIKQIINMAWYYMDKISQGKVSVALYEKWG